MITRKPNYAIRRIKDGLIIATFRNKATADIIRNKLWLKDDYEVIKI